MSHQKSIFEVFFSLTIREQIINREHLITMCPDETFIDTLRTN